MGRQCIKSLRHPFRKRAILAAALALAPISAAALDPDRRIAQYHHTRWTQAEGVPVPVNEIAQSPDGHLLLASGEGLFRFDGWRFSRLDTGVDLTEHGGIGELMIARSGDTWISYQKSGRIAVYRDGRLSFMASPRRPGEVIDMVETPDGAIWAGIGQSGRPLLRHLAGRWQRVHLPPELGRDQLLSMVVAADGALWLSYFRTVLRLPLGSSQVQQVLGDPYSTGRLTLDRQGRVWVNEKRGSHPISGPGGRGPWKAVGPFLPTEGVSKHRHPFFDKEGNLWLTTRATGLARIASRGVSGPNIARGTDIDTFTKSDGLSSDSTRSVLQDREGTLWVTTLAGLDRFRPATVVSEPLLKAPGRFGDILFRASDGSVYIAQANSVYRVVPHGQPEPILTGMAEPEAMCEGADKTIWMVFADRVIGWGGDTVRRLPKPSEADEGIYDCAFDKQGRFWASAADNGLYVWKQGRWQAVPKTSGAGLRYTALVKDKRSHLWGFSGRAALQPLDEQVGTRVDLAASGVDQVGSLHASTRGLLVSADSGIGELRRGKFAFANRKQVSPFLGATGLIETPQNEIWAMSSRGLVRTSRAELERAFADADHVASARTFDRLDGLADRYPNQSIRSLVQGGDGRIWLATTGGTAWVDPTKIPSNAVPPPVAITMIEAGGLRHRDPVDLDLEAGTRELVFDFAVLSHAMPERARVLYRLHGFDDRWIDPGSRRQAFYTNVPPGDYRFQVIAANEDGVWNRQGAEVGLGIQPTFLQSWWFTLLCIVAGAFALWLLYKVRIRQVGRHIRVVLEERLAERERIARELHDTLLQSVQGLILSFQAATEQLRPEDPKRGTLERTLKRADDVLAEGRDRVHLLRTSTRSEPLDAALRTLMGNCGLESGVSCEVVVHGVRRPVGPAIEDEVCAIAGEALRNIAQHSQATTIRVALGFGSQELTLSITDDGVGLPASVLAMGSRAGHFGLTGMRERAAEIGGTFEIQSSSDGGTMVRVSVPARVAYQPGGRSRLSAAWSRLWPQEAHA